MILSGFEQFLSNFRCIYQLQRVRRVCQHIGKNENHKKSQKYTLKYHTNTYEHVWSGFETFRLQFKKNHKNIGPLH